MAPLLYFAAVLLAKLALLIRVRVAQSGPNRMDVVGALNPCMKCVGESGRTREAEMRYNMTQDGEAVEIHVQDAGERAPQVLASLQECQEGRCGCPTDQYDRLGSIEVGGGDGELTVHLTPRTGEHLDPDELRACMDYTMESASDTQS